MNNGEGVGHRRKMQVTEERVGLWLGAGQEKGVDLRGVCRSWERMQVIGEGRRSRECVQVTEKNAGHRRRVLITVEAIG